MVYLMKYSFKMYYMFPLTKISRKIFKKYFFRMRLNTTCTTKNFRFCHLKNLYVNGKGTALEIILDLLGPLDSRYVFTL